jgi:hypothetical protein
MTNFIDKQSWQIVQCHTMSTKQKAEHVQTKPTTFVRLNLDAGGAESASNG